MSVYKHIVVHEHPNAGNRGRISEHRYIAANALGSPLPEGAVVHHHGGGKCGKGQLVICQDDAYHKLLHMRQRAYEATGDATKRKCRYCKQWDDVSNMVTYHEQKQPNGRFYHSACKIDKRRLSQIVTEGVRS
jgi:hypothetical protein